jgi:hypothetical protein
MTTGQRIGTEERRYHLEELIELRRMNLRYARSFSPGHERNQHRQTAMSLKDLFKNERWLALCWGLLAISTSLPPNSREASCRPPDRINYSPVQKSEFWRALDVPSP